MIRMLLLLFFVSVAAFTLVSVSPIDPLQANVGQAALGAMSQEQIAKLSEYWGVGIPPVERFFAWAGDFFRGDMGMSLLYRQPVTKVIGVKLVNSLWLMAIAWMLSGIVGFILGILSGIREGSLLDRIIKGYSLVIASTPAFWLALVLLMVFAVWLKVLPIGLSVPIGVEASGVTIADRIQHAILPAITLSITGVANTYAAYKGEDDRGYGERLCALCQGTRGKHLPHCKKSCAAQCAFASAYASVRFD